MQKTTELTSRVAAVYFEPETIDSWPHLLHKTLIDGLDHFNDDYDMLAPHLMTGLKKNLPPKDNSPSLTPTEREPEEMSKCARERKRCALDADGVQPPQVLAVVVGGIQDLHRSKQQQRRASSITERMTQPPLSWPLIAGDLDPSAPGDRRCRPVVDGDPIHLRS